MKTHRMLKLAIATFVVLCIAGGVMAGYTVWTAITDVSITSHNDYDIVHVGQEYTLTCTSSTDNDYDTSTCQVVSDPIVHTWSGPGTFTPSTGTSVTWIPPSTSGNVTITVTASDNSSPTYANDTDKTDSVILTVANTLYYVDADANGNDDGSSWTNAFNYLQDALDAVSSGDEIWVAGGTYYPDEGNSVTNNDRTESFQLVSNVGVYGGFAGTETARSQRNWSTNVTTLSGDIDKNGVLDSNNSYHVVKGTSNAVLDGFTVTKGYANGWDDDGRGGGMHNTGSYDVLTVRNCVFRNNYAAVLGGGICNTHYSAEISNCVFAENVADFGGGLWSDFAGPTIKNCVFTENTAITGGAYYSSDTGPYAGPTLINCTIYNNFLSGSTGTGGWYHSADAENATLTNCIIWGNEGRELCNDCDYCNMIVGYCDIEGGLDGPGVWDGHDTIIDGGGNINSAPSFVNSSDPDGNDNKWATSDDGLALNSGSPCIDAGNNDAISEPYDIAGNTRKIDGDGNQSVIVDMGAYEYDPD